MLEKSRFTIGRRSSCDLVIESRKVSRLHARINREGAHHVLSDAGSLAGVFVNGDRILGPYRLSDGDEIQLADIILVYLKQGADEDETEGIEVPSVGRTVRTVGAVTIDAGRREVWVSGKPLAVFLSRQEFALLRLLHSNSGQLCTLEEVGDAIWGTGNYDANLVHRLVYRLKHKLESTTFPRDSLQNIPGEGYKLNV